MECKQPSWVKLVLVVVGGEEGGGEEEVGGEAIAKLFPLNPSGAASIL